MMHTDIYQVLMYSSLKPNFNNFTGTLDPLPSHFLKVTHLIVPSFLHLMLFVFILQIQVYFSTLVLY